MSAAQDMQVRVYSGVSGQSADHRSMEGGVSKSVIRLQKDAQLEQVGLPEGVMEGHPIQAENIAYSAQDGKVLSGVWACEPGRFSGEDYPVHEICFVLEGKVGIIDDESGEEQIFEPGDSFVVPKGSNTTWVVYEPMKKFFMVSE
jgi:uncharacterized cupin superfamily protein